MGTSVEAPNLTQRRKAATRLDIARAAVELFSVKGVAATTAEEIAVGAGVSLRTLWRYTASKEACVIPLLTVGVEYFTEVIRSWPRGEGVSGLLEVIEESHRALPDPAPFLALVRMARSDPALRAVWLQAHDDAEAVYAAALAQRLDEPAESLAIRTRAAVLNNALRVATEHYAWQGTPGVADSLDGLIAEVRNALHHAATGFA